MALPESTGAKFTVYSRASALTVDRSKSSDTHSITGCLKVPQVAFTFPLCFSRANSACLLSVAQRLLQEVPVSKDIRVVQEVRRTCPMASFCVESWMKCYMLAVLLIHHCIVFDPFARSSFTKNGKSRRQRFIRSTKSIRCSVASHVYHFKQALACYLPLLY